VVRPSLFITTRVEFLHHAGQGAGGRTDPDLIWLSSRFAVAQLEEGLILACD